MNHNKTVLFLKLGTMWSTLIVFTFFLLKFMDFIAPKNIGIDLKTLTLFIIILITATTIFVYNQIKSQVHVIEYDVECVSKKFLFSDYYSTLLPLFIFMFGMSLFIISIVNQIKLLGILGFLAFQIGMISFFIINSIGQYDLGLKLSLDISYMIFIKYIYKKEIIDPFFIKKFTYFFEKYLKKVDATLYKGTKISNLTVENDNLSIRNIILYLPPYIKYGSQYEKETLKKSLVNMREFITKDDKLKSLKITSCILEIYKSEKKFVLTYSYQIEPISPLIKLYEDIKDPLIITSCFLFIMIMIISKSPLTTSSVLDFLQTDGMEKLLQPITVLLTSFLGVIVTFFGIIIQFYSRK